MKVVQLHEKTPKQCLNPSPTPVGPPKVKKVPKIKSKSNVKIERNKGNKRFSTT